MDEIESMYHYKEKEEVNDTEIKRAKEIRNTRLYFDNLIRIYCRENKKAVFEITKEEVSEITKNYTALQKELFIKQLIKNIETNFWKPIKVLQETKDIALFHK